MGKNNPEESCVLYSLLVIAESCAPNSILKGGALCPAF